MSRADPATQAQRALDRLGEVAARTNCVADRDDAAVPRSHTPTVGDMPPSPASWKPRADRVITPGPTAPTTGHRCRSR